MSDARSDQTISTEQAADSASEPAADVTLEIDSLTKIYNDGDDGVLAVDGMNVDVREGEFLVFVGPSGCGKTTTLRCVAGLEDITEGSIRLNGQDLETQAPRERGVAMVFQTYALYPHMTVRENIGYPLRVRGFSKEERQQRVEETAEMLQIPELLDRQPKDLSGGQQQRVALGRALVREPEIFLFDEPLSNLDAKLRISMRTELNRLHNKIGKTSIYVTHDQAEAMTLGDRIAVMEDAEIQQLAPPQTVYDKPVNQFVAGFIGSPQMNFFTGTVRSEGDRTVVETDTFEFSLPTTIEDQMDRDPGSGQDITFGIRPEDISVEETSPNTVTSEIIVVEEMGSDYHLTLERDGVEYQALVEPDRSLQRGDEVETAFDLAKCHLFDAATGESLVYSDATDHI
ncbi:ABC transporter ATP-binding protein [haloarchaeon 3A1-DGR]|nr:ABC transporter ATP-binding protein [haloarchaeon 3A1-DGR]